MEEEEVKILEEEDTTIKEAICKVTIGIREDTNKIEVAPDNTTKAGSIKEVQINSKIKPKIVQITKR